MSEFLILSISPGCLKHPGIAVATARAGGVGVLDLEFPSSSSHSKVSRNIRRLVALTPSTSAIGLRLRAEQLGPASEWIGLLARRPHWLVVSQWRSDELPFQLAEVAPAAGRRLWLERIAWDQTAPVGVEFEGWIARGSEAGGWCGQQSSYLLAQSLARQSKPFVVQGGIGVGTAAACRVIGAAGIVLDDQLLCMPESPLTPAELQTLRTTATSDTVLMGESLEAPCRTVMRGDLPASRRLHVESETLTAGDTGAEERLGAWRAAVDHWVGWGPSERWAWPVGQAVGWAGELARVHRTTGRYITTLSATTAQTASVAKRTKPLAPDNALARSHGIRYPVVQGPMTRVSDTSEFALAVAEAGGLPFIALALLRGDRLERLLRETRQRLGDRPWGVGILGFVPMDVRREQLEAIGRERPPFALIAGGRPDQALELEARGIATYLHAPSPDLLRLFLQQGARRFVFEGSECGGHVGPLSSFTLWQSAVDELLRAVPEAQSDDIHVLLAGGIHDRRSAAMAATVLAPIAARGMRGGVLMGTAYLFTPEAVACHAIVETFQQEARRCTRTVKLVASAGHQIRCVPTPFATEFTERFRQLRREGLAPSEIARELERMTLGRSLVASKGVERLSGDELRELGPDLQRARGMYMIGEAAVLADELRSIEELHHEVTDGASCVLDAQPEPAEPEPPPIAGPARIAVVGMACLVPGAEDPARLWRNLLDRVECIEEIPSRRFDWRLYYDPDPGARDRIYSRWGGFIAQTPFDPVQFGLLPKTLNSVSTAQLLALELTRRALADAGYADAAFDRRNTAVILGVSNPGDLQHMYVTRSLLPIVDERPPGAASERLPEWTEASQAGLLMNVIAGRVANRFDLGGPNLTVDAACASSLAALDIAVRELESGRSSMVITGGIDLELSPYTFLCFSKTGALSPTSQARVFDQAADGIVISEGMVIMVLKRLADAERDGDRVYGLVQSVAGSSDGKGMGITAPKSSGQRLALQRAYGTSGIRCSSISMYEAHGTGTAVGDRTELQTIGAAMQADGAAPQSCAVGSAKSLIGHTRAAAGMVGLLKALLAVHHKTLAPHAGVDQPQVPLQDPASPLYLLDEPTPWLTDRTPRRAGVSAFGFGGTNFHAIVEEYSGGIVPAALGAADWPSELFVIRGGDRVELLDRLERLDSDLARRRPSLCALASDCAHEAMDRSPGRWTVSLVGGSPDALREAVARARGRLKGSEEILPPQVHLCTEGHAPAGPVGLLFPGQGSQAPGMFREPALYVSELRRSVESMNLEVGGAGDSPSSLPGLLWPAAAFSDTERARQRTRLADTRIAQPAVAAVSCGLLDFARRLGLPAEHLAGHSLGEFLALHAANVFDRRTLNALAAARGRILSEAAADGPPSGMLAVAAAETDLLKSVANLPGLTLANVNAPEQCVLSGTREVLERAAEQLRKHGVLARRLNVSAAFHSPHMRSAREPLADLFRHAQMRPPEAQVYGNYDGRPYPSDVEGIFTRLVAHAEAPVRFADQIRMMYEAGVRTFVEIGPGSVLTALVGRILGDRDHLAISLGGTDDTLAGLLGSLGRLAVAGIDLQLPQLFAGRNIPAVNHERESHEPAGTWYVDGGRVRRSDQAEGLIGSESLVTREQVRSEPRQPLMSVRGPEAPTWLDERSDHPALAAYRDYQLTMRQFLRMHEETTEKVLRSLQGTDEGGASVPPSMLLAPDRAQAASSPPASPSGGDDSVNSGGEPALLLTRSGVSRLLVGLVSGHTGYPVGVLRSDQDLEGELGIDSIRRIQILTDLENRLRSEGGLDAPDLMDRLMDRRSLDAIVDEVMELAGAASKARRSDVERTTQHPGSRADSSPRWVMEAIEEELPRRTRSGFTGLVLVTQDEGSTAEQVISLLQSRGVRAQPIRPSDFSDCDALERRIRDVRSTPGGIQGIVHLAGLTTAEATDLEGWGSAIKATTKSLFRLVQLCEPELDSATSQNPFVVLAATALGGRWCRDRRPNPMGAVAAGGCHGLLRTLEREYLHAPGRVIDFDAGMDASDRARAIVDEYLLCDGDAEVGYAEGRRSVYRARRAPIEGPSSTAWCPPDGSVVLVTGGARGITAETARLFVKPGVQLVVVGRSPIDESGENPTEPPDLQTLRRECLDEAQRSNTRILPAEIEEKTRTRFRAQERLYNLARLRSLGAAVDYHAVDMRDGGAVANLLADVYHRYGRLDGVLHGAGVIEDQRLGNKLPASFDRVFDTKANSAFALYAHLRAEGLRWVVLFGSVAGRFGNPGQWDYAAANEVVNRVGWQMQVAWPETRVVVVNWGPWLSGMATPAVLRRFEQQGILPISPEDGQTFLREELSAATGDVEVIAGEGPWADARIPKEEGAFGSVT